MFLRPSRLTQLAWAKPKHFVLLLSCRYQSTVSTAPPSSATATAGACPPLRILFCGSDEFSNISLRALLRARDQGQLPISSIDVLCRPAKPVTQRKKLVSRLPDIANVAKDHGLNLILLDRFDPAKALEWAGRYDLIIAVSFGLLIPAHVIQACRYGGLNVHPSLLPDFRGAAPIARSLLAGCSFSGVSLQTLHPTKFDHGKVLMQQEVGMGDVVVEQRRLDLEESKSASQRPYVAQLEEKMGNIGADLLVSGLKGAAFLPPHPTAITQPPEQYADGTPVARRQAPKVRKSDREVNWAEWTADDILRRHAVLGGLWNEFDTEKGEKKLVKWSSGFELHTAHEDEEERKPGEMLYHQKCINIVTCDGKRLRARKLTPAGKPERPAVEAAQLLFDKTKAPVFLAAGHKPSV